MHASNIEFRYRFLLFGAVFGVAFSCYWIDPVSCGEMLADALVDKGNDLEGWKHAYQLLCWISVLLLAATAALRSFATSFLHTTVVHDALLHSEALVADGPYRYVRNPLYLSNFLMATGFAFMMSRLGYVVLLLGYALLTARLIGREEAELFAAQGERYRRYCAAVPRLLPALRPRLPASGAKPQWGQALLGEAWVWIFAIAGAAYAPTFSMRVYGLVMMASMAVYGGMFFLGRRRMARKNA